MGRVAVPAIAKTTIAVHELIGIFTHASAVLRWSAGSVKLTRDPRLP